MPDLLNRHIDIVRQRKTTNLHVLSRILRGGFAAKPLAARRRRCPVWPRLNASDGASESEELVVEGLLLVGRGRPDTCTTSSAHPHGSGSPRGMTEEADSVGLLPEVGIHAGSRPTPTAPLESVHDRNTALASCENGLHLPSIHVQQPGTRMHSTQHWTLLGTQPMTDNLCAGRAS